MLGLIFTYVMTYGGALVGLFRPYWGLMVYMTFAILKPESMWRWSVEPGNYSRTVAIGLIIGWLFARLGDWRMGQAQPIVMMLLAYWAWMAISSLQAVSHDLAMSALDVHSRILVPCVIGVTLIRTVRDLRILAWVLVVSQGYVAYFLNDSYFANKGGFIRRFREDGFGGVDNNCVGIAMVAGAGCMVMLALYEKRWWRKLLLAGLAVLTAHVVLLGMSRGGMLGLIATGVVGFVIIPRKPSYYLGLALVVGVMLYLAGPQVRERFATVEQGANADESAHSRTLLWRDCADTCMNHPFLGVGPDNWWVVAHTYGHTEGKSSHTLWLKVAAELGVPGIFFLAAFYGLCVWRLLPYTRESTPVPDPFIRTAARMVVAGLVGFAVAAQFVGVDRLELPYFINVLGIGVLKVCSQPVDQQIDMEDGAPPEIDETVEERT
jgi:probable O-glycosylation ligase (exosortase A-associated)